MSPNPRLHRSSSSPRRTCRRALNSIVRLLCLLIFCVAFARPIPGLSQVLSTAPSVSGFLPGQLRSVDMPHMDCRRVPGSDPHLDSLYRAYSLTQCDSSNVSLFFVRDTLFAVYAPPPLQFPRIDWRTIDQSDARRIVLGIWQQFRVSAFDLFGRDADSIVLAPPSATGSTAGSPTLTAVWSSSPSHPWSARFFVTFLGRYSAAMIRTYVEDPCVTTVPWRQCARR